MEDKLGLLYHSDLKKKTNLILEMVCKDYDMVFAMSLVFDKDNEYIDDPFWLKFYGVESLKAKQPKYISEVAALPLEMRFRFVLIGFILVHYPTYRLFDSLELKQMKSTSLKNISEDVPKEIIFLLTQLLGFGSHEPNIYINMIHGKVNFEDAFSSPSLGKCVKSLLKARIATALKKEDISDFELLNNCYDYKFDKVLGLNPQEFKNWLNGEYNGTKVIKTDIKNYLCIENVSLDFDASNEIYLLGENGDGKTLLLEALFMTYCGSRLTSISEEMGNLIKQLQEDEAVLMGMDEIKTEYHGIGSDPLPNVIAYGTHRGRIGSTTKSFDKLGFLTLFDADRTLVDPSDWIYKFCTRDVASTEMVSKEEVKKLNQTIQVRIKALERIFNIVLDRNIEIKIIKDVVNYCENGAFLSFGQLSEGYRTTLIFICDLLYRLYDNYSGRVIIENNLGFNAHAVVLIDEIDQHLHPRWQRTIVSRLRRLFPNVQFIMTTHSPHIIQGASDDAVIFRVYREDGKTCVSDPYYRKNLNHMMINTLATSPLFDLEDARLDPNNNDADTADSYLISRIEQLVRDELSNSPIRSYLTPSKIDEIIMKAKAKALAEKDNK